MKFTSSVHLSGKTATGIKVPDEIVGALGAGQRPAVRVSVNGHIYRSTIAPMGGEYWIPLSAENRAKAGVAAGEQVDVAIELDTAPRELELPADFVAALDADAEAKRFFETLSFSNRRWHVDSINGAKTEETRARRIERSIALLRDGRAR